jgi:hypothetical protein
VGLPEVKSAFFIWFLLTSLHVYRSLPETLLHHPPLPTLEPARCVAVHLRRVGRALSAFDMSRDTCAASDVLPCVQRIAQRLRRA